MANPKTTEVVQLTPAAYRLAMALYAAGAFGKAEDVPPKEDRSALPELIRKKIAENVGGARGKAGKVKMLVPQAQIVLSTRAPRGSGGANVPTPVRGVKGDFEPMYIEDANVLLSRIQEEETLLNESMGKAINDELARLTKELTQYTPGSQDYLRVFRALNEQVAKKERLTEDIRKQAFANIRGDERYSLAKYLRLFKEERPPRD